MENNISYDKDNNKLYLMNSDLSTKPIPVKVLGFGGYNTISELEEAAFNGEVDLMCGENNIVIPRKKRAK